MLGRDNRGGSRGQAGLRLVLILVAVLAAAAAAWWVMRSGAPKELTLPEAREMNNPVLDSPQVQAEAKALYTEHCAHCHGDEGDGQGPEAMMYDPSPADFTRAAMANIRDGELFYKITEGRKPMPSFKKLLTDDQRWKLVRYIRTFASKPAAQR